MSECPHLCWKTHPPKVDRCNACGKSYYEIIVELSVEIKSLRAVLYQARSTADNYGASAGIDVIEDYLEEAGE